MEDRETSSVTLRTMQLQEEDTPLEPQRGVLGVDSRPLPSSTNLNNGHGGAEADDFSAKANQ